MNLLKASFLRWAPFAFLLPYIVGFTPADSSVTDISFGSGVGNYVHSDCNGTENRTFVDAAFNVTKKIEDSPVRIGLTAGAYIDTRNNGSGVPILFPEGTLDFESFAIGTTGLRIGSIDNFNFQVGWFNSAPIFTGKGAFNAGVNFNPGLPVSRMWIGANVFPYRQWGVVVQPEFPLDERRFLFVTGRYGISENRPEWGVSAGVRIRK